MRLERAGLAVGRKPVGQNLVGKWRGQMAETDGGDRGIRTLDRALQPYNGLANRRLQPLGHISVGLDMPDPMRACKGHVAAPCFSSRYPGNRRRGRENPGLIPERKSGSLPSDSRYPDAVPRASQRRLKTAASHTPGNRGNPEFRFQTANTIYISIAYMCGRMVAACYLCNTDSKTAGLVPL